jgi:hypothetical protein
MNLVRARRKRWYVTGHQEVEELWCGVVWCGVVWCGTRGDKYQSPTLIESDRQMDSAIFTKQSTIHQPQ